MTTITQRMREELVRRNYAEKTTNDYLRIVENFRLFFHKRLDHMRPDDIRRYQVYLLEKRKLGVGTVVWHVAALRFLYVKTLKRYDMREDLPYPKRLPVILSQGEVARLIDSASNLLHYTMLLTLYSAGLRRAELCRLRVANIDSERMMLRIEHGKGDVDREVPLNPMLLERLREYWRWMRPPNYLFPGTNRWWRVDKPITPKVVWNAVQQATRRAGIDKHVTPHTLRHCFATHLLEASVDLRPIQLLMGHKDIESTAIYLHVSKKHLQAAANPLEQIPVSGTAHRRGGRHHSSARQEVWRTTATQLPTTQSA